MIPKPNKPGKRHLIVDLSYPEGHSIDDGISSSDASMIYSSIDDAASLICDAGKGALLAKTDIASALRIIPVHPGDGTFQVCFKQGRAYVDKQLPFGLRSAPDKAMRKLAFQGTLANYTQPDWKVVDQVAERHCNAKFYRHGQSLCVGTPRAIDLSPTTPRELLINYGI